MASCISLGSKYLEAGRNVVGLEEGAQVFSFSHQKPLSGGTLKCNSSLLVPFFTRKIRKQRFLTGVLFFQILIARIVPFKDSAKSLL